MTVVIWGRKLLVWGLIGAGLSAAPLLVLLVLPGLGDGFFGLLAFFVGYSMVPLCLVVAAVGTVLAAIGLLLR